MRRHRRHTLAPNTYCTTTARRAERAWDNILIELRFVCASHAEQESEGRRLPVPHFTCEHNPRSGGIKDGDENFVVFFFISLVNRAEEIVVDFSRDVSGFNGSSVYEHFFWADSAKVNLATFILV